MYELKGKLHLYKCMHSDNTEFKMFIYTQYNGNMRRQMNLLLTAFILLNSIEILPTLLKCQLDNQYY